MREELSGFVAIKVKPLRRYAGLSAKHAIRGYPTVVLLRPDGSELGRIVGFKPPEEFLRRVVEIRRGRTLDDLVARLRGPAPFHDDLGPAAAELRERGRFLEALDLLRTVHRELDRGCCEGEVWRTEVAMQARLYREAEAWATSQREAPPPVPGDPSVTMLASLLAAGPVRDDVEGLRRVLRESRRVDTEILGSRAPLDDLSPDQMSAAAELLFDGGACRDAARLWRRAVETGVGWTGWDYLRVSSRLLDAGTYLETAGGWARRSLEEARRRGEPGIEEGLLLAQIEAKLGRIGAAVATARQAAGTAVEMGRLDAAHEATRLARRCGEGRLPDRWKPPFEQWPW